MIFAFFVGWREVLSLDDKGALVVVLSFGCWNASVMRARPEGNAR